MTSLGIVLPTINDQSVLAMNTPRYSPDWHLMQQPATKTDPYVIDLPLDGVTV